MINKKLLLDVTRELSVLCVDDDKGFCENTQTLLKSYFSNVEVAFNAKEGLEKYKAYSELHGDTYSIVITDISMPEINGLEMSKEILKLNENQSIIIATAHNSQAYFLESIMIGIDGFLLKPIKSEQLFKTLFKVSQSIHDHKMIESYVEQVEDLNIELQESNRVLQLKNSELEKSLRMLDTVIAKEEIIHPKVDKVSINLEQEADIKNQISQLINDDLFELTEILTEIDVSIIAIIGDLENIHDENIEILIKHFARYATILHYYTFFNELGLAMSSFSHTIRETPLPQDIEVVRNIFTFLETFVYVLSKWHKDLSSGDESKLNQLDASIISDMTTIENMWTQRNDENVNEEDLDDIFDF